MKKTLFLLLAVLLPSETWAQNGTSAAANAKAKPGANLCGHVIDAGTFIDARAQNASHDEAVVLRWLDEKGASVHSALYAGRCVAIDGDSIDSKLIVRVLPNSLAISDRHGLAAWEAEYWDSPSEHNTRGASHRGVFNENRFVAELDPTKASEPGNTSSEPDFRWNEEQEALALKVGIVLVPAPARYGFQKAPQPNAPAPSAKPSCTPQAPGPKVSVKVPAKASTFACQHFGICSDNKPVVLNPDNGCPAAPAPGQPAK